MEKVKRAKYAAAGTLVLFFAGLIYAWSVISAPIAEEFPQWTKAQLSLTFTLAMITFCAGQLICGALAGKIKPRYSVLAAAALLSAGFYIASRAQSLTALYLGFGLTCGFGSGLAYNSVISTVVKWFPDKTGLVSGVMLMGFGGGSFVIGKLFEALTPEEIGGWRLSFAVLGALCGLVLAVCSFLFVNPQGQAKAAGPASAHDSPPARTLREPAFWL